MKQLDIFSIDEKPKKVGLLQRCHLYKDGEIEYTAFPSLKGMKLLKIKYGTDMVLDLTVEEYESFIEVERLKVVKK